MSSDFSHYILVGGTGSGKTTLATDFAKRFISWKQPVIVHTSADASSWPHGCKIAEDVDELEALLKRPENFGSFVFVDECLDVFEDLNPKKHKHVARLHRKGRHQGYTTYYIAQDLTGIPPQVRRNVKIMYCFNLGADAFISKMVERNFPNLRLSPNEPLHKSILNLQRFEFLRLYNGQEVNKYKTSKKR